MITFVLLRNSILSLEEISIRITEVEKQFPDLYNALDYLIKTDEKTTEQKERAQMGYQKK